MKCVVVIGAGGFGREVVEIFKDQNKTQKRWNIAGFIDEDECLLGRRVGGYRVLGGIEWLKEHNTSDLRCVCAIGDCRARKNVVDKLRGIDIEFCNAIHPSVIMSNSVELGKDVIICAGSILTVNIKVGDHVHIDTNCTIGHDCRIGSYSRLNPGAKINGNDQLGNGVYVGSGATLIQNITVGNWSTIGAGAVVIENIPDRKVAVGVPARVIKEV